MRQEKKMTTNIGGSMTFNPNPQPSIFEKQTSGEDLLRSQGQLGRGVPISQDYDNMSLANIIDHNKFQGYRSDQPRPYAPVAGKLRSGGANEQSNINWQNAYDELLNHLPPDLQEIADEPELQAILSTGANVMAFLNNSTEIRLKEVALANKNANIMLPQAVVTSFMELGQEVTQGAKEALDQMGANDPSYLPLMDNLAQFQSLIGQMQLPKG